MYKFTDCIKSEIDEKTKIIFSSLNLEKSETFLTEFEEYHQRVRSNPKSLKKFLKKDKKLPSILKDNDTNEVWDYVFTLFLLYENCYKNQDVKILEKIANKININEPSLEQSQNKITVTGSDNSQNESRLINTIINDIKTNINNNGNDLDTLLKTTKDMGTKYQKMINDGEMSLDDMMNSMLGMIKNPQNILENINDLDLSKLPNPQELMSKIGNELGIDNNSLDSILSSDMMDSMISNKEFDPSSLINTILSNSKIEENTPLTEDQLKELEEFYSKLNI
jgi:hypothetical protein